MTKDEIRKIIRKHVAGTEIDPKLVEAFIQVESEFNSMASRFERKFYLKYVKKIDRKTLTKYCPSLGFAQEGAFRSALATSWGLLQIMGLTACELGYKGDPSKLTDPNKNIYWGVKYLKKKMDQYPELDKAISAYNAGTASLKNHRYVDKVMNAYAEILEGKCV